MRKIGEQGFSLVEVLAAITLMAVAAALISQALRFGVAASDRLSARTDALTRQTVSLRTLSRLVSRALPPGPDAVFEGRPHRLTYTRLASGTATAGPLVLADLELSGKVLILRECPASLQDRRLACQGPKTERLRADFETPVRFAYQSRTGPPADHWPDQDTLPNLLKLDGGSPPLVIRFDLGTDR